MSRKFQVTKAVRRQVPMLVGLVGASGSGKTYSALRLATGMASVTGGRVIFIDTESNRALHYADEFDFDHVQMEAPFSPLDYLDAIQQLTDRDGKNILVVDSMSHEHEGPGGVLDQHDKILDKRAGDDWKKRNKMTFGAWAEPKAQRRKLINGILRLGCNAVFCFRAKEKLKLEAGKDPVDLGWQPIAGDEFVYEMTVNLLLYPGAEGRPTLIPDNRGERVMVKVPDRFKAIFPKDRQLDEQSGVKLAEWAAGAAGATPKAAPAPKPAGPKELTPLEVALTQIDGTIRLSDLEHLRAKLREERKWPAADANVLRQAFEDRSRQLEAEEEAQRAADAAEAATGDSTASDEDEDPAVREAFGLR